MHWIGVISHVLILWAVTLSWADHRCTQKEEWKDKRENGYGYICRSGAWYAYCCVVPWDGTVLMEGQRYRLPTGWMVYECGRMSPTELQLRAVACLTLGNVTVLPMQTIPMDGYTITCVRQGLTELTLEIALDKTATAATTKSPQPGVLPQISTMAPPPSAQPRVNTPSSPAKAAISKQRAAMPVVSNPAPDGKSRLRHRRFQVCDLRLFSTFPEPRPVARPDINHQRCERIEECLLF